MSPWSSLKMWVFHEVKLKTLFHSVNAVVYSCNIWLQVVNSQLNHKGFNNGIMHGQETQLNPMRDWNQKFACEELSLSYYSSQWCLVSYLLHFSECLFHSFYSYSLFILRILLYIILYVLLKANLSPNFP